MARSHDLQRCTAACGGTPPKIGSRPQDWLIISWCREVPFPHPTGARHRLFGMKQDEQAAKLKGTAPSAGCSHAGSVNVAIFVLCGCPIVAKTAIPTSG